MARLTFNHTDLAAAATAVAVERSRRQMKLGGGAWTGSPALVRSRI
jgi:hypothetical protein